MRRSRTRWASSSASCASSSACSSGMGERAAPRALAAPDGRRRSARWRQSRRPSHSVAATRLGQQCAPGADAGSWTRRLSVRRRHNDRARRTPGRRRALPPPRPSSAAASRSHPCRTRATPTRRSSRAQRATSAGPDAAGKHARCAGRRRSADRAAERRRAAALPRSPRAHGARADPRLRRAARTHNLRGRADADRTDDLLRPRRPVAGHRRRAGPARRRRARLRERPGGTTAYGTSIGYPRLRAWIADRHGVEPERVLVTNGSMQADAFLFEHLVRPGDDVVVERPTYDRTLLSLRERGATLHAGRAAARRDRHATRSRACSRTGQARPKLAHIIPNFQNPAGYTLSLAKRQALLALAAQHDFLVFEDDPYVALRFSGESLPTMLSMDPERVVYASSFSKTVCPGIRVGYLVGPPDADRGDRAAGDQHLHLAEHGLAVDRLRVLRLGRDRALDRDRPHGARRARADARRSAAPRAARGRVRRSPRAATSCGSRSRRHRRRAPVRGRRRTRRGVRQGHRLPARGRREHAAPGLLGRHRASRSTRASRASPRRTARSER